MSMPSALILGEKCLQLFSIHTIYGCDTIPYHYEKGKITVLNNLFVREYAGLINVLGKGSIKHAKNVGGSKTLLH